MNNTTSSLKFIATPLSITLSDFLDKCGCVFDDIRNNTAVSYLLESLYLKISGQLEQKFRIILWQMSLDKPNRRYDLISNSHEIPSKHRIISAIYTELLQETKKLYGIDSDKNLKYDINNDFKKNIFSNKPIIDLELKHLFDLLSDSIFSSKLVNLFLGFKYFFNIELPKYNKKELEEIYNFAISTRNNYAHNINSIYPDEVIFPLNRNLIQHNYLVKLSMFLCVDRIIRELWAKYENNMMRFYL